MPKRATSSSASAVRCTTRATMSGIGKDHTLFALIDGVVTFRKKRDNKSYVSVHPVFVTARKDWKYKRLRPEGSGTFLGK